MNKAKISPKISILRIILLNGYWGFIGALFGLIGIILTIYLSDQSKVFRNFTYYTSKIQKLVFDSTATSHLRVYYGNDTSRIFTNIYSNQFIVWNKGKESIKSSNILDSIGIIADHPIKILEINILGNNKNRMKVTNISVLVDSKRIGIIWLKWDILEQNDGLEFQIIYAGNENTTFSVIGTIEGQSSIYKNEDKPVFLK